MRAYTVAYFSPFRPSPLSFTLQWRLCNAKLRRTPTRPKQWPTLKPSSTSARASLLEVTNRARVEFGRFQKEKAKALKQAVIHFVRLQIEHAKQAQAAWENVLPDLENLP